MIRPTEEAHMDDQQLHTTISRLTEEEHVLELSHQGEPLSSDKLQRLESIRVSLDQCWDLLRQRRARREVGLNPDEASVRAPEVVEGYEQ
jgi:hypothetical protein